MTIVYVKELLGDIWNLVHILKHSTDSLEGVKSTKLLNGEA